MLIDTHAHLYWESYQNDLDQVIQRSLEAGVTEIINVGVDVNLSKVAANLTSDKIKFYSTIGIHPHEAIKYGSDVSIHQDMKKLERLYQNKPDQIVAVGECGLDFAGETIKIKQRQLFKAQIDLAKKLNLPLIIHCRDDRTKNPENSECWDEVLEMTKDWFGLYHCYSGLPHNTKYIIHNTNFLVSFAATITYPKNEYLREAVKMLPLERIVLETDCPFLPPQSKRGQRNEPASVREVAQMIADLKGLSLNKVALQTTKNVKIVFSL